MITCLTQFLNDRKNFLLAITQNRERLEDTLADELMFFYARLAMWMMLLGVSFVYFLFGFLNPDFAVWARKSVIFILLPGAIIAMWLSYRGEMVHLLYATICFQVSTILSWFVSIVGTSDLTLSVNYYLILPVVSPVVVGSIIVFCLYPKQIFFANLVFFSLIVGLSFLFDPNAMRQYPAFVSFIGVVMIMGIFVISISNITSALYASIAEKEEKQTALAQVQTVINDGLDAAPFGLLCYRDDGTLLLERGVSSYFPDRDEILTQSLLDKHLAAECGLNLDDVATNSVQVQISGRPIMITRKQTGTTCVYSFVDMTERQDWEKRVLTAEKMGLVGQITSGVTHDYNNCLAVAIGGIERISRKNNEKIWDEHLELVFNALDQARQISRKLLALSGTRDLSFQKIEIREIISSMQPLLASVVYDDITVKLDRIVDATIVTDRGELEAALLNLVINAKNAIEPQSGTITIQTVIENDEVVISVIDDGPGIPDSVIGYIFDPFYSTNKGRNASGMGLTSVKSFMDGSNGAVVVQTQPGHTKFELRFPLDPKKVPAVLDGTNQTKEKPKAQQIKSILLIDDNSDLLNVMSDLIEERGISCYVAETALEAHSILKETKGIDAVFIDLSMPDINGIDLGIELMETNPDSRFYLLTGERLNDYTEKATEVGFRGVYFKPLRVGELLEAAAT